MVTAAKGGKKIPAKKPVSRKAVAPSKKAGLKTKTVPIPKKTVAPPGKRGKGPTVKKNKPVLRYRCKLCGYIYSPLRGEPHNGIPAGTEFDDLPEDYVCPVCGFEGKGKIGRWGFEEWHPTRYICSVCGYVYDEKRGEPHRGIKPGTKFENLPDSYVCPVCALDPKIRIQFGKVFKQGFEPVNSA